MRTIFYTLRSMLLVISTGIFFMNCNSAIGPEEDVQKPESDTTEITAVTSKTQFAEAGGKKIAFRAIGNGKPLILCTRFRATLDDWDPAFLDELAKTFRVITFDYSGIGRSGGDLANEFTAVGEDVKALTSYLKIDKFIMAGWSWGGMLTQTFAV